MSVTFFTDQEIIEITEGQLAGLKRAALESPFRRARLCLHQSHEDQVQEMVIAFCRDTYNRPHRHRNKSESFHVIEGQLVVVFFNDAGEVLRRIEMGPYGGAQQTFLYRLASTLWHTVVPRSEFVIIHETTTGPFRKEDCEFAPWGPDEHDVEGIKKFIARIAA